MTAMTREQRATFALRGKAMVAKVREFSHELRERRSRPPISRPTVDDTQQALALENVFAELEERDAELAVADEELQVQVAELERVGDRLVLEKERFEELFELAPDPYFVTDRLGLIRDANSAAASVLGVERSRLRRKPLASFVDASTVGRLRDAVTALRSAKTTELEVLLRRRGRDSVWYELRARASADNCRISWIARDIAARKDESDSLALSNAELERRVAERTEELARALRDKDDLLARERVLNEQLASANRAKDRFLAILSHDLRSPINAVLGWTSLLRRERLSLDTREKALAKIERNARAQAALVEGLLDVSRIAAGRLQLDLGTVDLAELARHVVEANLPEAEARNVALVDDIGETRHLVLGDASRLRQVATNLVTNALKFTPGGGTIHVSVVADGAYACLCVRDTGRGIAPSVLPHVFDLFRQGKRGAAPEERLGLGLYIVRHVAEMHGGRAACESEGQGKGAAFSVFVPLRERRDDPPPSPPAPESSSRVALAERLDDVRVLIVDDDLDGREMVAMTLDRVGADVLSVADAATALDALAAFAPDVVVSDIGLPTVDGHELVRRMRKTPDGAHVPAIAVTGFASADDARAALDAGYDAHIAKPIDAHVLVDAIATVLRTKHA